MTTPVAMMISVESLSVQRLFALCQLELHFECFNFHLFPYLHALSSGEQQFLFLVFFFSVCISSIWWLCVVNNNREICTRIQTDYAFNFNWTIQWTDECNEGGKKAPCRYHCFADSSSFNSNNTEKEREEEEEERKLCLLNRPICSSSAIIFTNHSKSCYFPCNFTLARSSQWKVRKRWVCEQRTVHYNQIPLRMEWPANRIYYIPFTLFRMFTKQQSDSLSLITLFFLSLSLARSLFHWKR